MSREESLITLMVGDLIGNNARWDGFNFDKKFSNEQRLKIKTYLRIKRLRK